MSESAESVVRAFCAAFAVGSVDELAGFFSEDAVWVDGPRGTHVGFDAIKVEMGKQLRMIPIAICDVPTLVAQGNTVLIERVDNFEVGGQPFALEVAAAFEVDEQGRITRWRDYYDLESIARPTAAAAGAG